jgi:hypothetical protein
LRKKRKTIIHFSPEGEKRYSRTTGESDSNRNQDSIQFVMSANHRYHKTQRKRLFEKQFFD